ncbi:MAG TPA: hypothetical protein DCZ73_07575 [Bacteroides sp.]|nr:SEL1-like repeat protein [Phocaeicola coprophilus]HBB07603.1 hypothetical protein [Bacteroides sp.]
MPTDKNQRKEEKARMLECALPVGTVLRSKAGNEYTITGVLGAGGFGITYKAVSQVVLNKKTHYSQMAQFAIKEFFMKGCYRGGSGTDMLCSSNLKGDMERGKEDFKKEADVLIKLNGSSLHIVMVNEQFEANGTCYYVMDYLEGQSLQQYMERRDRRALTEAEALALLLPVARAVALLHSHHLLHLDIKPDNIMLKETLGTDALTPVLIDFGLAKHFDSKGRPTSSLMARGATEGYAPLEQYSQLAYFAPEIDVYALGATLFFLLTGTEPARAHEILSTSISAYLQKYLPVGVSQPVREAIEKAMQPIASARMQTVGEFVAALEPVAGVSKENGETSGGETVQLKHDDDETWFKKKIVVIGVACLVVLIGGVLFSNAFKENSQQEQEIVQLPIEEVTDFPPEMVDSIENVEPEKENAIPSSVKEETNVEDNVPQISKNTASPSAKQNTDVKDNAQQINKNTAPPVVKQEANDKFTEKTKDNLTDEELFAQARTIKDYTALAEKGYAPAQYRLGIYYYVGYRVYKNDAKAVYWWTKAAEQGNSEGQYILGDCYYKGEGVTKDYEKAAYWWTKAAEQGNEDAQKALDRLKPIM